MSDKTVTLSKHEGVWDRDYVEDLEKDRERLEWLVENQCYPMPTKNGWCLTEEGCFCWPETSAKGWREAVDEAMEGE